MSRRLLGSGLLLAIAGATLAQVDPARVVAVVNGEEIKGADYYRAMETIPNPARPNAVNAAPLPTGLLAIDQLIRDRLIQQFAKEKGVAPTDAEVQAEFDAGVAANPNFLQSWKAQGKTEAELKAQIRSEIAQYKLVTNGVTVTDQEIDAHYKEYKDSEFTVPRRYQARVIVVRTDAEKAAVDKELQAGKTFDVVAKSLSLDASAQIGGILSPIDDTALNPSLREAFKGVGPNQNTKWVQQTSDGVTAWAKFRMDTVTAARVMPLDATLRKTVRRKLALAKGGVKFDLVKQILTFQSKSKIEIKNKQFADQYKILMDGLYAKQGIAAG